MASKGILQSIYDEPDEGIYGMDDLGRSPWRRRRRRAVRKAFVPGAAFKKKRRRRKPAPKTVVTGRTITIGHQWTALIAKMSAGRMRHMVKDLKERKIRCNLVEGPFVITKK